MITSPRSAPHLAPWQQPCRKAFSLCRNLLLTFGGEMQTAALP
jgi:hypothetical protein